MIWQDEGKKQTKNPPKVLLEFQIGGASKTLGSWVTANRILKILLLQIH
jgi:hypothetical protein